VDLKIYYQKIRDAAGAIPEEFPVVVSSETQDGGKAGVCTEVPQAIAARMLVDGRARIASGAEAKAFRDAQAAAKRAADEQAAAARVQVQLIPVPPPKKG